MDQGWHNPLLCAADPFCPPTYLSLIRRLFMISFCLGHRSSAIVCVSYTTHASDKKMNSLFMFLSDKNENPTLFSPGSFSCLANNRGSLIASVRMFCSGFSCSKLFYLSRSSD
uniref:Uncharacterized protein n=1 Tax=Oryza brachyantha TaxID=4533 RepID=J3KXB4_ORYBR